jgi:hypothetical protein
MKFGLSARRRAQSMPRPELDPEPQSAERGNDRNTKRLPEIADAISGKREVPTGATSDLCDFRTNVVCECGINVSRLDD